MLFSLVLEKGKRFAILARVVSLLVLSVAFSHTESHNWYYSVCLNIRNLVFWGFC